MRFVLVGLSIAVFVAGLSRDVRASEAFAEAAETTQMTSDMRDYFDGEKSETAAFVALGASSILAGAFLVKNESDLYRGMSYPFMAIGLLELIVGGAVYLRTDQQVADLSESIRVNPSVYRLEELTRMEKVNYWFDIYKFVEFSLVVSGVSMAIIAARKNRSTVEGFGIGLAAQATLGLGLDILAEGRADVYTEQVRRFAVVFSSNAEPTGRAQMYALRYRF